MMNFLQGERLPQVKLPENNLYYFLTYVCFEGSDPEFLQRSHCFVQLSAAALTQLFTHQMPIMTAVLIGPSVTDLILLYKLVYAKYHYRLLNINLIV